MAKPIHHLDLGALRLFVSTVESGSFTAGADGAGLSLAAASKRIAELESQVGQPLLLRHKRGVVPTAAGQTLLRHAVDLLARVEQLAVAMDDYRHGAQGHLRLCANTSAFGGFLPSVLAAFSTAHPEVRIDLEDVTSDDAARAVANGSAELAVIGENTPVDGLHTIVCDRDDLVLLLPQGHALAGEASVPIEAVLQHDLVALGRATSLMRQIVAAAESTGHTLRIRVQVRSFDAMGRMVAAGLGLAVLPRAGAAPHAAALGLVQVPLQGSWTQRRLLLAMRDRAALSVPAQAFVALVEQRLAEAGSTTMAAPR